MTNKLFLLVVAHIFGSPVVCGTEDLPPVAFDWCDPDVRLSEIQRVFVAKANAASFTDWTDATEWNSRIDNTTTSGDDYIRVLTVIADKPAPTTTMKDVSGARQVVLRKEHIMNITIDETTAANHAFVQSLKQAKQYKLWYETAGGKMFGGNDGILVVLTGDMVLARGQTEAQVYNLKADWKLLDTEDMIDSPIFDTDTVAEFDTVITFDVSTAPVHGSNTFTTDATNVEQKFEYNDVDPATGPPGTMTINVSAVEELVVDFTLDFLGATFRYTDLAGDIHLGTFTNGTVNF